MTVGFSFVIGFFLGGCCAGTAIGFAVVKHLVTHRQSKKD